MHTELENWKLGLAKARLGLAIARRKLDENARYMILIHQSLQDAQARVDAIKAAANALDENLGRKP